MVTRTTQNHVKETPKQPYQTIVSIGCLACALMQQITMKYATDIAITWAETVTWNLNCHLPSVKATWHCNLKDHQCKYKVL